MSLIMIVDKHWMEARRSWWTSGDGMEWNGQWPKQPASTRPALSMWLDSKPWKAFQPTCFCDSKASSCSLTYCRAGSSTVLLLQWKFNLHLRRKFGFHYSPLMVQTRKEGIKALSQTYRMNLFKGYFHSFAADRVNNTYFAPEKKKIQPVFRDFHW